MVQFLSGRSHRVTSFFTAQSKENGSAKTPIRKKNGEKLNRKTLIMFILTALYIYNYRVHYNTKLAHEVRPSQKHAYIILTPLNPTFI